MADSSTFRVVEFYSGIGGMHYALKGCKKNAEVVAALEISTTANTVYGHNFPTTKIWNCNIEVCELCNVTTMPAIYMVMSPPCQPYTWVGLQGASKDPRALSFLHILSLLKRLQHPPKYWLIENVKGFETSDTRFYILLAFCNSFIVSSPQFGIPNSRLRYYLLAKRHPLTFSTAMGNKFSYYEQFLLPTKVLSRFSLVLDIVTAKSRRSCCFTKAYGHYAEGTGSV
ncbi:predicted protein, partial [Nematostella vectensis]